MEEGGDTVWNVGTSVDEKGGYSYSVIKFHKDRPGVTGTMMIEDAQVRDGFLARKASDPFKTGFTLSMLMTRFSNSSFWQKYSHS